jgi:hypothetical protein
MANYALNLVVQGTAEQSALLAACANPGEVIQLCMKFNYAFILERNHESRVINGTICCGCQDVRPVDKTKCH